jgi:DNA-directed RNA polymerase specialized sigma24 family protein
VTEGTVPEPADASESTRQRRLFTYLTALLPGEDVTAALEKAINRIVSGAGRAHDEARRVAAEHRKAATTLPFSDDLFRQLADSADPILNTCDRRSAALDEVLHQLPSPERQLLERRYQLGLTVDQIAITDDRTPVAVQRDQAALHESLVSAMRAAVPDAGPEPPGGAADIGRLSDQLLNGTITDDGRLVLETLLLADAAAQAHYHRHAALIADLRWKVAGPPRIELPKPAETRRLSGRELAITVAFVIGVLAVIVFTVLRLTGPLADS